MNFPKRFENVDTESLQVQIIQVIDGKMIEQLWVPHWGNCSGADSFRGGK